MNAGATKCVDPPGKENARRWTAGGDSRVHAHVVDRHQDHHGAANQIDRRDAGGRARGGRGWSREWPRRAHDPKMRYPANACNRNVMPLTFAVRMMQLASFSPTSPSPKCDHRHLYRTYVHLLSQVDGRGDGRVILPEEGLVHIRTGGEHCTLSRSLGSRGAGVGAVGWNRQLVSNRG